MKKMRLKLLYIITIMYVNTQVLYAQENPASETGKKIGTIVKSAIDTALPGVSTLINLIWNRDGGRMNKDELETRLKETTKQLKIDAQKKVLAVGVISDELLLVNRFLEPSVKANILLLKMSTRISTNDSLSDIIWQNQKEDWQIVKNHLDLLKNISNSDLEKVREMWLKNTLKKIRDSNLESFVRIEGKINQKNINELKSELEKLSSTLNDITAVVGYELSDLTQDMKGLSEWADGAAAGNSDLNAQQKLYKDILTVKYKTQ